MLVVDASAMVEVLTTDPGEIPGLVDRVRDAEWLNAPALLDYEVLNVLRKMLHRGDIDSGLADGSRAAIRELRLMRHALTDVHAERMWQLRHTVSSYDAAYIALAEELDLPLITVDLRLAAAARQVSPVVVETYAPTDDEMGRSDE